MALFSQDKQNIRITTPLGPNTLLVESIHGSEGMSRLFTFELSLLSEDQGIAFDAIIGKSVTISVELSKYKKRHFNGIISRFAQSTGGGTAGGDTRVSHYRATIVPWFWLLSRSAESRIYQNLSVPEIVELIFKAQNLADFEFKLQKTYQKREYCVQYRESHFNFVSRLLEEEGIHYFFEHSDGKHKMVIADGQHANILCPEQPSASYQVGPTLLKGEDLITSLEKTQEIRPAKYCLSDFNFQIPNTSLKVELPSNIKLGPGEREIYDYPGQYEKKAEGDQYARLRMEEEEAQVTTITGSSNCRAFSSGHRFKLRNYYRKEMIGQDFILTTIEHHATQAAQAGGEFDYGNRFTCMPADIPFRPARITPKPHIQGAQTAMVVGPAGEEIYVDEYGRVKVQFHWDREGKKDEKSSCWVRVSQLWAGESWGAMFIPRIRQEVIVDFLEGDPDRPIITGRVYNGANRPPYQLPADKTKSTIKSNSSPGGNGYNELRFEDKKGEEEIYLQGEKDWNILIKNDKSQHVGHDESLTVGNDRTKNIGVNQTVNIGANHSETIGANKYEKVIINKMETIGAAKELLIGAAYQVAVGAAMNETVGAAKTEEVGGAKVVMVGAHMSETVLGDRTIDTGKAHSVKAQKILVEAQNEIVCSTGSASISMKSNGDIVISGSNITVKGSGNVAIKGQKIATNC